VPPFGYLNIFLNVKCTVLKYYYKIITFLNLTSTHGVTLTYHGAIFAVFTLKGFYQLKAVAPTKTLKTQ
jgi:hypothetical protein